MTWKTTSRTADVAQRMRAKIQQIHPVGQGVPNQIRRRLRTQHLPAMAKRHDPGGAVQHRTEIIATPMLRSAAVQSHPHPQRPDPPPRLGRQRALRCDGRGEGIRSQREHGVDPIPRRLHHMPTVGLDGCPQHVIVTSQRRPHRLGILLPLARRRLEVREEERDRSRGQLAHRTPLLVPGSQ